MGLGLFFFFNPFVILGAVVTLLALWVSKHLAASRLLLGGTYLVTDVCCHVAVFSSFWAFACLFLGGGCAYNFRAHLCSPLSIRLQCSDDSSLHTFHYPFISLTKRLAQRMLLGKWYDGLSNLKTSCSMCFPLLTMVFQKNIWLWQEFGQFFPPLQVSPVY